MRKIVAAVAGIVALSIAAFSLSPWPSVMIIRQVFDRGALTASDRLEARVPKDIRAREAIQFDPQDRQALLDIHEPPRAAPASLPTIVWVHGGGFVSGRRQDVANYAKILAGRGFAVVNLDYRIAPEATYPAPVRQVGEALRFISANGPRLGIASDRILLAGDSAGAQIAAQVANLTISPDYAQKVGVGPSLRPEQLKGLLLFCGPYDLDMFGDGWFSRTTAWAYSGKRNFRADRSFQLMSVAKYVTAAFPPAFITAGNGDPLEPQSVALAKALRAKGVRTETLFFPGDRKPALGHEYQFDLRDPAAVEALDKAAAFARQVAG